MRALQAHKMIPLQFSMQLRETDFFDSCIDTKADNCSDKSAVLVNVSSLDNTKSSVPIERDPLELLRFSLLPGSPPDDTETTDCRCLSSVAFSVRPNADVCWSLSFGASVSLGPVRLSLGGPESSRTFFFRAVCFSRFKRLRQKFRWQVPSLS